MSTILVTGASGFVGSHTVPALVAAGHRVVALVRTAEAGDAFLEHLGPVTRASVDVRTGDVTAPATLQPAMAGVDAVVHLAAIPRDRNGGADLRRVNTEGTRAVLAAMAQAGVGSSTWARWAWSIPAPPPAQGARGHSRSLRHRWTIVKPSLQFGEGDLQHPGQPDPGVARDRAVPGDGSAGPPIHADDVAAVVVRVLADPTTVGGTFELGGPRYWSYREITREVAMALGKRRAILRMPIVLISVVAGTAERLRIPFPVATDQLRLLKVDNIGPLDLIPTRFRFDPRPMEGALGYLRRPLRDQRVPSA
jgi:NADH dehydrogenase